MRTLVFAVRIGILLSAFVASPAFGEVTIHVSARIVRIPQQPSNAAVVDFITKFGLHVEVGEAGYLEIPFEGSYSFDYPQNDQAPGPQIGSYALNAFRINGVPVVPLSPPGGFGPTRIQLSVWPCSGCSFNRDTYYIQVWPSILQPDQGLFYLQMFVNVPAGTLTDALPPDAKFFAHGIESEITDGIRYDTTQNGTFSQFDGSIKWLSATVEMSPSSPKISGKTLGRICPSTSTETTQAIDSAGRVAVGNPCNVATGNKFDQITDYETAGPDTLGFTRYYNSFATSGPASFATTLGLNWRSNFDRYIRISSPTAVSVERPHGRVLDFTLQDGVWTPDTDVDFALSQAGATWKLIDGQDAVEIYSTISASQANLTEITARNGYRQTLLYDERHAVVAVTDSYGLTLKFTYSNGLLDAFTTPDGLIVTFGYTVSGVVPVRLDRLSSVTYSTSPVTSQAYLYEDAALPFALTGIDDENGQRFASWTYDPQGRALSSEHAGGAERVTIAYNDTDGSRTVTNALGLETLSRFTTLQGVPKVTQIDRLGTATTRAASLRFTYDANGYRASATDWNGTLTTYVNDARGLPTAITEAAATPEARTTTITYDSRFHLPATIVQPGLTTEFTRDADGNPLTRTDTDTTTTTVPYATNGARRSWTYTWSGGLLSSVQGPRTDLTAITRFGYSGSALSTVTNALGQVTHLTQLTPGGRPMTIVDPNGVTTQLAYDERQRLLSRTVNTADGPLTTLYARDPAGNILSVMLPDGSALTNRYDAAHRLTSVSDVIGEHLSYTLDPFGNRTAVQTTDANGAVTRTHAAAFDALGRLLQDTGGAGQATRFSLDANGNPLTSTDPLGRVTGHLFDPLNRLVHTTDPANGVTVTSYDALDRPLNVTDPNGATTAYVYDGFGNLIQTVSPDSGKTIYRYDLAGNLIRRNTAGGAVIRYTYDALNRVRTVRYPDAPADDVSYHYDQEGHGFSVGRLTSVDDAIGRLHRIYDERGNVLREVRVRGDVRLTTAYQYDAANQTVLVRYPSGARVAYRRDTLGRISDVTLHVPGTPARSVASAITYQPFGPVSGLTFGNGIVEAHGFDRDYRLTTLTGSGATAPVQQLAYSYDAADNVRTIADGVQPAASQTFGYDRLDRLTGAVGAYGSQGWTYDPVGNRLTQQSGATLTSYTYAAQSNRLTRIQTGGARQIIFYTVAGNIAEFGNRPAGGANTALVYNEAGRLTQVLAGAVQIQGNAYDAFGQRLVRTGTATGTTLFQYDLTGHLLEDADGQGRGRIDYIYLGDRTIATLQLATNQLSFLHDDRLDTPQLATNSVQGVVWKAAVEPFGAARLEASLIGQNLRFPGQEFDADTGWHHNGFRDYLPTLGRYLQSDLIGLAGGLNLYTYGQANPISQIDPYGLVSTEQLGQRMLASGFEHAGASDASWASLGYTAGRNVPNAVACIRGAWTAWGSGRDPQAWMWYHDAPGAMRRCAELVWDVGRWYEPPTCEPFPSRAKWGALHQPPSQESGLSYLPGNADWSYNAELREYLGSCRTPSVEGCTVDNPTGRGR